MLTTVPALLAWGAFAVLALLGLGAVALVWAAAAAIERALRKGWL